MNRLLRLLLVPFFLLIVGNAYAGEIKVPALNGRVNDLANLLSPSVRLAIQQDLKGLEEKTGVQIAILTVPALPDGSDIKSFSIAVAEKWKLGQKGKDNGLLIMYSVKEDRYRIEVGYGLEGAIPDGKAGDIIRNVLRIKADPAKGTHDFDAALSGAVHTLSGIVGEEFAKDPTGQSMRPFNTNGFVLVSVVAFLIASLFGSMIHEFVGGIVGAAGGVLVSYLFLPYIAAYIGLGIIGFILGIAAKGIASGDSPIFIFIGGGDGGDSFSGGGGGFGGGGADG